MASTRFISKHPRAIITGDYDNDGATDLLITQNHGPAVLLKNEGGNQNHWLRLALKGLNDNKSAIGTKVEVFSGGNRQKFEIYGSNGYLGQNSPYLTVGLGDAKEADIVRMLWPTGVLQDEIQVAGDKQQDFLETRPPRQFVSNIVCVERRALRIRRRHARRRRSRPLDRPQPARYSASGGVDQDRPQSDSRERKSPHRASCASKSGTAASGTARAAAINDRRPTTLSFRFMEPLEEAVYLDQVRLLAVDHPANVDVYPNEYFASNPPYPRFKVVVSQKMRASTRGSA